MATYALYGEIKFPAKDGRQEFYINRFSDVRIDASWKGLTDTAEITIPRNLRDFDKTAVSEYFREGDPVEIWLGYGGNLSLEFQGYIKKVPAGIPLVISLEDEMYQLKRKQVSVSIQNCKLRQLLETIAPGYSINCDDVDLGTVRFEKMSAAEVLEKLQKNGIYSWFEGKELHSFGRSKNSADPVDVQLEKTAGDFDSVKQKEIENVLVVMNLIRKKGRKIKVEYGDENAGVKITRQVAGINLSEAEMKAQAKKIYEEAKTPGLDGDLTLFGIPRVQHGHRVNLTSELYPEKNGTYYIDAVTKTFDLENVAYRQQCKLGVKA